VESVREDLARAPFAGRLRVMSTPEKRLEVAISVLGDDAWVKTWIHHTAVVKLLDALIEAREIANLATGELSDREMLEHPRFTGPLIAGFCACGGKLSGRCYACEKNDD